MAIWRISWMKSFNLKARDVKRDEMVIIIIIHVLFRRYRSF